MKRTTLMTGKELNKLFKKAKKITFSSEKLPEQYKQNAFLLMVNIVHI